MGKKIPREEREREFLSKVSALTGKEYTVLSEYSYNNVKVRMRHEECGREFEILPKSFTSDGSRCHYCSRESVGKKNSETLLMTHEEYKSKLENRQGKNTFELLSKYKGSAKKVKIRHNCTLCENYEGWVLAGQLMQKGCPSMLHKKKRYSNNWIIYCELPLKSKKIESSHEAFMEKLSFLPHGSSVEIIGNYINAKNEIDIRCLRCDTFLTVLPQRVVNNTFCRECGFKRRNKAKIVPFETMMERVDQWFGEGVYKLVNPKDYIDSVHHSLVRHETCGYEWEVTMTNLTRGFGCPMCNTYSKGELWITEILKEHGVPFKIQQTFPDLKNERLLRFDFSILNDDGKISHLLEYNGMQHYKETPFFSSSTLQERRKRDLIKIKYANNNNIPLYIIPYIYDSKSKIENLLIKNRIIKEVMPIV